MLHLIIYVIICPMQSSRLMKQYGCLIVVILLGMYVDLNIISYSISDYHLFVVTIPSCLCQEISSPFVDGQALCPGTQITLTCVTRGATLISWRSIDYISRVTSSQLEFGDFDSEGTVQHSSVYNTTIARLTNKSTENGVLILVSELKITIRPEVASFSIFCLHDNTNENNITLRLLGMLDLK